MPPDEKNKPMIMALEKRNEEIGVIKDHIKGNYNNATAKEVVTRLIDVSHWIKELIRTYKK